MVEAFPVCVEGGSAHIGGGGPEHADVVARKLAWGPIGRPRRSRAVSWRVDEYRLVTRPVALGSGEPMFKDLSAGGRLELDEATAYPDGTVISIYRRPK